MSIESIRTLLGWGAIVNLIFLSIWFFVFVRAHDWIYMLHRRWFDFPSQTFDTVHYALMAWYKLTIWMTFIIPYLVLRIGFQLQRSSALKAQSYQHAEAATILGGSAMIQMLRQEQKNILPELRYRTLNSNRNPRARRVTGNEKRVLQPDRPVTTEPLPALLAAKLRIRVKSCIQNYSCGLMYFSHICAIFPPYNKV